MFDRVGLDGFAHLAVRTCFSLLYGVIRPRELAVATLERGMGAVGIADRGGLYGAVRIAEACRVVGVRPIFGADLALAEEGEEGTSAPDGGWGSEGEEGVSAPDGGWGSDRSRPGWRIRRVARRRPPGVKGPGSGPARLEDDAARVTLIARTQHGYANLCRTVSDHHLCADRGDPHVTWAQLARRPDGLFALLGDDSPVARLLDAGRPDAAEAEARRWMDLVGPPSVLVGVTHHLAAGDDGRARARFRLADRLGLRAVVHQAPRYLDPADARVADVLDAIRQQTPLDPRHSSRKGNTEGYLKSPEQIRAMFAERPDAVANAAWVAQRCEVDLGLGRLRVPDLVAVGEAATTELRARCEAGMRERFERPGQRHLQLLDAELAMIAQLGLAPYFLTVAEIVERIRSQRIMVACRGSAAGSLVTYVLRISDVDPIAHDLCFERFMNPYRDELPDIDIDVESARRADVYRDLFHQYGEDRVACVAMFSTFRARMAIREVGKALGLPAEEIGCLAQRFPHIRASDVRPALTTLPELRGQGLAGEGGRAAVAGGRGSERPDLKLLFDLVERLDGLPRHVALHPSGVLLADATLRDLVPVERSSRGFVMAQFNKDDVAALGLCKLDVLGVRMLSAMAHAVEEASRVRGVEIDLEQVPWDDEPTFELIRSTRTLGMFQIESPGQRELIGKFQPEHLADLVIDISLFRPGPVKGDMITPFLQRRLVVQAESSVDCEGVRGDAPDGCEGVRGDAPDGCEGVRGNAPDRCEGVRGNAPDRTEGPGGVLPASQGAGRAVYWLSSSDPQRREAGCRRSRMPRVFPRGPLGQGVGGSPPIESAPVIPHPLLERALRETFGVIVYHEQVMRIVAAMTGCDLSVADRVRRQLGDPEKLDGLRAWFLDGARERGVPGTVAERVWAGLAEFASFGFCKAHAAAFAVLTYRSAWLKAHYLPEFAAGLLTHDPGMYPRRLLLEDARQFGVCVLPLDVNRSWRDYRVERVSAGSTEPDLGADPRYPRGRLGIRIGLQDVAGIDDEMIDSLLAGRPFTSVEDLRQRSALSAPVAEALAHVGALDDLGGVGSGARRGTSGASPRTPSRRDLLLEVSERWAGLASDSPPGLADYSPSERVRAELEVLGLDVTCHVLRFYDGLLARLGVTRAADLLGCYSGQRVRVAGVKVATQTPPVRSGQRVIFLSLDDTTGVSDTVFFESVHDRCAWTVFHTWLLLVEGTVRRTGRRGVSINAVLAWDLCRLMRAWRQGSLDEALAEPGTSATDHQGIGPHKLWHSSGGSSGR
ncbi:MAG: DNA polymerase III subunit alpha [Egibacteraceae bacterium]